MASPASQGPAGADTFPKLLIRNARSFGDRPAMRHKDLGIWQTLTWAQLLDEVRAYASALTQAQADMATAIT